MPRPPADIDVSDVDALFLQSSDQLHHFLHGLDKRRDFRQLRPDMLMNPDDIDVGE